MSNNKDMKEMQELSLNNLKTERLVTDADKSSPPHAEKGGEDASAQEVVKQLLQFEKSALELPKADLLFCFMKMVKESLVLAFSIAGTNIVSASGFAYLNTLGKPLIQASFGICSSYFMVFFMAIMISNMDKLGITLAQAYGKKDYSKCRIIITQGAITTLLMFGLVSLPLMLNEENLLLLIGLPAENCRIAQQMANSLVPAMIVQCGAEFLKTVCFSQGHESIFGRVNFFNVPLSLLLSYVFIIRWDMEIQGWVYSKLVFELVNLCTGLYVFLCWSIPEVKGFVSLQETFSGLGHFVLDSVKFTLGTYSEFFGFEITSYFVAVTGNNDSIAAYTSFISVNTLLFIVGLSFATICRTRLNLLMGMHLPNTARNFFFFFVTCAAIVGLVVSVALFSTRTILAEFFANSTERMKNDFFGLLSVYVFAAPSELSVATSMMGMKTLGRIIDVLKIAFIFYVLLNFITGKTILHFGGEVTSLFAGLLSVITLMNITLVIICYRDDWNKAVDRKHDLESEDAGVFEKASMSEQKPIGSARFV